VPALTLVVRDLTPPVPALTPVVPDLSVLVRVRRRPEVAGGASDAGPSRQREQPSGKKGRGVPSRFAALTPPGDPARGPAGRVGADRALVIQEISARTQAELAL
jgi:hypothetical protein